MLCCACPPVVLCITTTWTYVFHASIPVICLSSIILISNTDSSLYISKNRTNVCRPLFGQPCWPVMDPSCASFDLWLQNTLLKSAVCNRSSRPVQLPYSSGSTNIHVQSSLTSISHNLLLIHLEHWSNRLHSLHDSRSKSKWCLSSHLLLCIHPSTSIALPAPPSVSGNQPPLGRSAPRTTSPYLKT